MDSSIVFGSYLFPSNTFLKDENLSTVLPNVRVNQLSSEKYSKLYGIYHFGAIFESKYLWNASSK